MNEIERLRNDARAVIADCHAGDDIEAAVTRLAAIGYALDDALGAGVGDRRQPRQRLD